MEEKLGRFAVEVERPEPIKFAWPIVLFPELFTTTRHLGVLIGYLATIGWEVYAPDLRAPEASESEAGGFAGLVALAAEALDALGRDSIVLGHGIGGLVALKLAERPHVKAAVAYAPLIPGFATPLFGGVANRLRIWRGRPLAPPSGRMLFEFVADADPFARDGAIAGMTPGAADAARDVIHGDVQFAHADQAAPRLVVAGEVDIFAPLPSAEAFASALGAQIVKIAGRGHWLIGGRALERAIGETQRFLVRALGQDLLLLYPEEWKE